MGVVGDELRDDDVDAGCVLMVVVASIFRSALYADRRSLSGRG
jgi:hypothetical protein